MISISEYAHMTSTPKRIPSLFAPQRDHRRSSLPKRSNPPGVSRTNLGRKRAITSPVEPSVTYGSAKFSQNRRSAKQMGTICIQQIFQSCPWSKT